MHPTVWTVGHSTHPIDDFIALLESAGIAIVADVRRFPGSRRYPQYNQPALIESLDAAAIDYVSFPDLGGRRQPRPGSPHNAWRNAQFRAYADHMDTDIFRESMDRVIALASARRTALMCSEAVWWRCHRGLIADYLKVRGHDVVHLLSPTNQEEHPYTSAARVVGGRLSYSKPDDG